MIYSRNNGTSNFMNRSIPFFCEFCCANTSSVNCFLSLDGIQCRGFAGYPLFLNTPRLSIPGIWDVLSMG